MASLFLSGNSEKAGAKLECECRVNCRQARKLFWSEKSLCVIQASYRNGQSFVLLFLRSLFPLFGITNSEKSATGMTTNHAAGLMQQKISTGGATNQTQRGTACKSAQASQNRNKIGAKRTSPAPCRNSWCGGSMIGSAKSTPATASNTIAATPSRVRMGRLNQKCSHFKTLPRPQTDPTPPWCVFLSRQCSPNRRPSQNVRAAHRRKSPLLPFLPQNPLL